MKIRPLGDRVLVEPIEEKELKKGGIIIPDTAKEKPQEGKVIAIGTGKRDDDGKLIPFNVKAGDHLYPNGRLQERVLNIVPFLLKYGPAFVDKLDEAIDLDVHEHQILTL